MLLCGMLGNQPVLAESSRWSNSSMQTLPRADGLVLLSIQLICLQQGLTGISEWLEATSPVRLGQVFVGLLACFVFAEKIGFELCSCLFLVHDSINVVPQAEQVTQIILLIKLVPFELRHGARLLRGRAWELRHGSSLGLPFLSIAAAPRKITSVLLAQRIAVVCAYSVMDFLLPCHLSILLLIHVDLRRGHLVAERVRAHMTVVFVPSHRSRSRALLKEWPPERLLIVLETLSGTVLRRGHRPVRALVGAFATNV